MFVIFQDQSENAHDGDLYDDVITSRDDAADEVCCCDVLHYFIWLHLVIKLFKKLIARNGVERAGKKGDIKLQLT